MLPLALGVAVALRPEPVFAHAGGVHSAGAAVLTPEVAAVTVVLATAGLTYARGVRALWASAGTGAGLRTVEVGAFALGLVALGVALLVPAVTDATALFTGHMLQHLAILVVAAPLVAWGRPFVAYSWALRVTGPRPLLHAVARARRSTAARLAQHPAVVLALYLAVVWAWHLPGLYEAATARAPVHGLEHATMGGAALLFWTRVRSLAAGAPRRQVMAMGLLAAAMFPELALGAFLSFAHQPLYESHRLAAVAAGARPLMDQQLGGLSMLMLGGLVYTGVLLALALRLLARAERSDAVARGGRSW